MIFLKNIWQPALEEVIKKHVIVERLKGASLEVLFSIFLLAASGCTMYALNSSIGYVLGAILLLATFVFTYYVTLPKSMEAYLKQYGRDEITEMMHRMNKIIQYSDQQKHPGLLPIEYTEIATSFLVCLDEIMTLLNGTMTNYRAIQCKYIDSGLKEKVIEFSSLFREFSQGRAIERFVGRASENFGFTDHYINSTMNQQLRPNRLKNLVLMYLRSNQESKAYTYKDGYRRIGLGESVITKGMNVWLLGLPYIKKQRKFIICEVLELPSSTRRICRNHFKTQ